MALIPPDLLDRIRRIEEAIRELRGRLPAPPTTDTTGSQSDTETAR